MFFVRLCHGGDLVSHGTPRHRRSRAHTVPALLFLVVIVAEVPFSLWRRTVGCAAEGHPLPYSESVSDSADNQRLATCDNASLVARRFYWALVGCVAAAALADLPRLAFAALLAVASFLSLTVLRSVFLMLMSTLNNNTRGMDKCDAELPLVVTSGTIRRRVSQRALITTLSPRLPPPGAPLPLP